MPFIIDSTNIPTACGHNWVTAALCIQMDRVVTAKDKEEARFRLMFLRTIRNEDWFAERVNELLKPEFSYTCNCFLTRSVFMRNILRGIEQDVEYRIRKQDQGVT